MNKYKKQWLKFYADNPFGEVNKLFVYEVSDYENAIDLAAKYVQYYSFNIRAAYYVNLRGKSIRFDNKVDLKNCEDTAIEYHEKCIKLIKANKYLLKI